MAAQHETKQNKKREIMRHHVKFEAIDPLGDGLGDDIEAERNESDGAMTLEDRPDETALVSYWEHVVDDIHADPEWFSFADEE